MKEHLTRTKHMIYELPDKSIQNSLIQLAYGVIRIGYKMLWNISRPENISEKKYKVSVCAIFKNEALYLREWLEFHKIVGVEHFYLYNNNSEDNYLEILEPYIASGWVTLVDWPKNQAQMEAYKDCIKNYSDSTKWLGFIDIDEFVVPRHMDDIYSFLEPFEKNRGAVKIYWRMYGTSGRINRDVRGLVTEDFTVCWPKHYEVGKCFYNTAYGFDAESVKNNYLHHSLWANNRGRNLPTVDLFDHVCLGAKNHIPSDDFPIQINHYFTKSYQEYSAKRAKGDVYFKINPHDEEYFYNHEKLCETVDYSAYKYLIKLKLAMSKEEE